MTPPATASAARTLAPGRPLPARRPRRISGPGRPPGRSPAPSRQGAGREQGARRARTAAQRPGLVPWLIGAVETLSSHRMLDRLIRSRLWIGIIAFALLGIVALQLGLLKMNSGIGRSLERTAELQRENAALSIENSELTSGERVESEAAVKLGMRLGSVSGLKALTSHARTDVGAAATALQSARTAPPPAEGPASSGSASETASSQAASAEAGSSEAGPGGTSGETGTASTASQAAGGEASSGSEASTHAETGASSEAGSTSSTAGGEPESAAGGAAAPGG